MIAHAHWRVSLLYLSYFALVGASGPFMALYLAARSLSIEAIGLLMAMPQMVRILAPPFWGWLADSGFGRARVLRVSAPAVLLSLALLAAAGDRFAAIGAALLMLHFSMAAQNPITESMAIVIAGGDAGRYGRMRVWGSVGFIVAVAGLGMLLDHFGAISLPGWLIGLAAALAAACFWASASLTGASTPTPKGGSAAADTPTTARASGTSPHTPPPPALVPVRERLRGARILAFLAASFWMIFAHAALYAFLSLFLQRHGYSGTAIGLLWALGVIAEILLFWFQRPLFERFGALRLLGFSLLVAAGRFLLIGVSEAMLPLIVLAQLLHAITFGVHHSASMSLLQRWFAPAQQARAQAVYATVAYGLGGSAGALASGWTWAHWSPPAAFVLSALAALLGWVAVAVCRRRDYAGASEQGGGARP